MVGATYGKVRAAFAVGNQIVQASERLAIAEAVRQQFAVGSENADHREFGAALVERASAVGTRPLDGVNAALSVHRNRAAAMRVCQVHELFIVDVQLADRIRLLLSEDDASIGSSHDSVGGLEIRPDQLPLCPGVDDARNAGHDSFSFSGQ